MEAPPEVVEAVEAPSNKKVEATPEAVEATPKFLEGLEKYFKNDLEGAKEFLDGDDLFSKSLLALVDVKMSDGSNNKEIQERIDAMDFKGNDIALMFCVLAQEYGMKMAQAHNLLLKRFGKEEKNIASQAETDAAEAEKAEEEVKEEEEGKKAEGNTNKTNKTNNTNKPNNKKGNANKSNEGHAPPVPPVPSTPSPTPAPPPPPVPPNPPATKQAGGKRVTRKAKPLASSLRLKKRVSRGKA